MLSLANLQICLTENQGVNLSHMYVNLMKYFYYGDCLGVPKKCHTFTVSSGISQQMKTTFCKSVTFFGTPCMNRPWAKLVLAYSIYIYAPT